VTAATPLERFQALNKTIPAPPGYSVIRYGAAKAVQTLPIVAWAIADVSYISTTTRDKSQDRKLRDVVLPVTVAGIGTEDDCILCPDGRVIGTGREWPTRADWLADA
jgi:hypothetical protein